MYIIIIWASLCLSIADILNQTWHVCLCLCVDGEVVTGDGSDAAGEGMMAGEEGGGWDVDDDELELPADLVSTVTITTLLL